MRSCDYYYKFCYLFSILTTFSVQFVLYFKLFWSILLAWFYHLIIVLNYFDYICNIAFLAGSTLIICWFYLDYFAGSTLIILLSIYYYCAFAFSAVSLLPLWYQSHSFLANDSVVVFFVVCLCLPETLILLCCVPFLPSLAPPILESEFSELNSKARLSQRGPVRHERYRVD